VAPTIAAQLGVLPVSVAVFGWPSALALPANLLAAPVAGVVMLVGIPMALVAGTVPAVADLAMILPTVAVRWVDTVALVAARVEPPRVIDILVTLSIPLSLVVAGRFSRHRCANLG
jgi:competence protein ComEC